MVLNRRKENGITLIALVITVIILLILAGVAMSLITGQNGLFARANHAGYEYDRAAHEEKDKYDALDAALAQYVPGVGDTGNSGQGGSQQNNNLQEPITEIPTTFSVQANATNVTLSVVPASMGADGTTYQYSISTDGMMNWVNPRISTDTSHTFTGLTPETQYTVNVKIGDTAQTAQSVTTASQVGMKDVTTVSDAIKYSASAISATDTSYSGTYKELTDSNNATVKVPVGFTVRYDSAATVDDGIVVADQNDNQWVWIPVNANNPYTRTWFGESGQEILLKTSATVNEQVRIDGINYYIYYEAEPVSGDVDYDLANRAGGYYIARYEAGSVQDTSARTIRFNETIPNTVSIKRDQVPYDCIAFNSEDVEVSTNGNMIDVCNSISVVNNYKSGITTKLCSSYAWDTALTFVGNESWAKGIEPGHKAIRQNYMNSEPFRYKKISSGIIVEANKTTNDEMMLTGQGDATKNIYDMGGNCVELTTESSSYSTLPYIFRGGYYQIVWYAGDRITGNKSAGEGHSFRPTLYL